MGITQKIIPHYTYEDYLLWEGNWELIDGFPIAMSPAPVPKHQLIAASLRMEIGISLKRCKNCRAYDPIDYLISNDTVIRPDILVLCKKPTKKYLDFTPSLVVEILSPSSALRDRNTKFEIYQNEGIKYYLIVDTENKKIEIYQLIDDKYELMPAKENNSFEFNFEDDCLANVNLEAVWVE